MLIWLALFVAWGLLNPAIRKGFFGIVRAFFVRKIVISMLLMLLYILGLIVVLRYLTLWNISQLTATIFWVVSVALAAMLNLNSITEEEHYFTKAALEQIQFLVLFEFIVSFYVFDLWAELIIAPLAALIGGMLAVAESDPKYDAAKKFLSSVLVVSGFGLIIFSVYKIAADFSNFATSSTLRDLVVFPLMSLAFLPFIYILALFVRYEGLFLRLSFFIKDKGLLSFAKRRSLRELNVRLNLVNRWAKEIGRFRPQSREDILKALADLKAQEKGSENA